MDSAETLHFFLKENLKEVTYPRRSLMPDYPEARLDSTKLRDLVAYLASLRGSSGAASAIAATASGQVPYARLLAASREPQN